MVAEHEIIIRSPIPGEFGWIILTHGQYYAEEFGWGGEFECIVAKIVVEFLSKGANGRQACFIAELRGKPVGSIMLVEKSHFEGKLRVMFVSADVRGKGIGTLLIQTALNKAVTFGYKTLSLETTDNQKAARVLYKKIGFTMVSSRLNTTFAKGSNNEEWRMKI